MARKENRNQPAEKPQAGSFAGVAGPGESIDPMGLPEEEVAAEAGGRLRAAPAPGVPMSEEEYQRLKRDAKVASAPPVEGQEDPSQH